MRLLIFALILLLVGCDNEFYTVSAEEINKERVKLVESLTKSILEGQRSGDVHLLNDKEAVTDMVVAFHEKFQKSSYEAITGLFGEYEDLRFHEVLRPKDKTLMEVYRFKGEFSSKADVEIRATLNGNQKLTGLWIIKWKDKM